MVEENFNKIDKLDALAKNLGMSLPQLGVSWCLKNKNVSTVILGASKEYQLEENLKASELKTKINAQVMEEIEIILDNKPNQPQF